MICECGHDLDSHTWYKTFESKRRLKARDCEECSCEKFKPKGGVDK